MLCLGPWGILDVRLLDAGCWNLDVRYGIFGLGPWIVLLDIGPCILDIGYLAGDLRSWAWPWVLDLGRLILGLGF